MPNPPSPRTPAAAAALDAASEAPVRAWIRQRPIVLGLYASVTLGLLAWGGLPAWRLGLVGALVAVVVVHSLVIAFAWEKARGELERDVLLTLFGSLAIVLVNITLTGGLRSPMLPSLLGIAARTLTLGWSRPGRLLIALLAGWVVGAAMLAPWLQVPLAPTAWNLILIWSFFVVSVYLIRTVFALSGGLADCSHTLACVERNALEDSILRARERECVGARVAHDLRTPLATLVGLLEQERKAAQQNNDERARKRLEVMSKELARMDGILTEYLSFSRPLEALATAPADLGSLVDNVLALLDERARAAGVKLARTGPGITISCDGRRLSEALLNLTSNALEATPRGGSVEVVVQPAPDGGRIKVCDSGVGMGSAVLEKVGTPFFTTREGGTGLGVALARAAISSHGGTLTFHSRPGAGTTAEIVIPGPRPAAAVIEKGSLVGRAG
jgi:signal transduction histidine kinase